LHCLVNINPRIFQNVREGTLKYPLWDIFKGILRSCIEISKHPRDNPGCLEGNILEYPRLSLREYSGVALRLASIPGITQDVLKGIFWSIPGCL